MEKLLKNELSKNESETVRKVFDELANIIEKKRWEELDNGDLLYHHRGVLLETVAIFRAISGTTYESANGFRTKKGYLGDKLQSLINDVTNIAYGDY